MYHKSTGQTEDDAKLEHGIRNGRHCCHNRHRCVPRSPKCICTRVHRTFGISLQVDDTEVINFLLSTEIIPLCLRTMEMGSELSKTVATFIVQKILLDNVGLNYICATAERFFAVGAVLGNMVRCDNAMILSTLLLGFLLWPDGSGGVAEPAVQRCLLVSNETE